MAKAREIAAWLDVSTSGITHLTSQGVLPKARGSAGRDPQECVIAYIRHLRKKTSGDDDEDIEDELREERILQVRESRIKTEIQNKRLLGELIPVEFISFALGKVAPSAAAVLDSLPMTLRRRHPDLTPSQLETINRELAKCMNEIASLGENLDEVLDEYQRITEK